MKDTSRFMSESISGQEKALDRGKACRTAFSAEQSGEDKIILTIWGLFLKRDHTTATLPWFVARRQRFVTPDSDCSISSYKFPVKKTFSIA